MNNINITSNTRSVDDYSIDTSSTISEVLDALNLDRNDVDNGQLALLDAVLTVFAINAIEGTGGK